jgi:hypothetical protein
MRLAPQPFTILLLAPFHPVPETGYAPRPALADLSNLDDVLASMKPRLRVDAPKELCPQGTLELEFSSLRQFRPQHIATSCSYLQQLHEALAYARKAHQEGTPAASAASAMKRQWPELPLELAVDQESDPNAQANSAVDDILSMVASTSSSGSSGAGLKAWISQIEDIMSRLMAVVYADDAYRTLEAAWRGLETILKQGPVREGPPAEGGYVQVKIAAVSRPVLAEALSRLKEDLVLETPHLVLIDCPLDNTQPSIDLAGEIAEFADTLLSPTAFWLTARFLHIDDFTGLNKVQYLTHHLQDAAYAKWSKLTKHPGAARMIAMINRFAVRPPYGPENNPKTPMFRETEPLWLAPVYALGALTAQSAVEHGWPTRFTDYMKHQVKNLACGNFNGLGDIATETPLDEGRIGEFTDIGITPLVGALKKDIAIIPKETVLDGSSLKFQLFFSRLISFLLWLKDNLPGDVEPASGVQGALSLFFQQTTGEAPQDLEVTAEPEENGLVPLQIALTPPRSILHTQRLQFGFAW